MPPVDPEPASPIAVIGAGHVGLVTAVGFTHHGIAVRLGEADGGRRAVIEAGDAPFHEEGLPGLVHEAVSGGLETVGSASAIEDADAVVVATEWPECADLDPAEMAEAMSGSVVVDARNVMDRDAARAAGLDYRGIGR